MEIRVKQQQEERIIYILASTLLISVMSATMFNIVLPDIAEQFQLSIAQVSWVTSGYLLVYAVGTVIYGKLADTYGLKNVLTFGFALLALGSLFGLFAGAYWMVLLGRVIQAAGAAVIPAAASIIPVRYYPEEHRGRALGIAMTGMSIGSALGPVVAALVVSSLHWRWLFFMPVLTLIALPYYRKFLKDETVKAGRIDWLGGGLLVGAAALLLLAITYEAWLAVIGCAVLFVSFVKRIRYASEPFVPLGLLRNKGYAFGLTLAFLATGIGYSLYFLTPQLLNQVHHLDTGMTGFVMVPAAAAAAILGRRGGKLADVKGIPFLFFSASAMLLLCFALMSSFAEQSPIAIAGFLIFGVVGQSFLYMALSNQISRTLAKERIGVGMGLLAMSNFMAGAVSASIYGKIVDQGSGMSWNPMIMEPKAFVYSNLYFVLGMLHICILLFYWYKFGRSARDRMTMKV
ncbi:MFS transporter [Paenibacillus harenae]|uniref:MFS transporter n=1 Tax=Paenibacillus harenae TaxID=306543 RepID=UPI00278F4103|nr:MFS transporter [Paenibacillus harenae]MDQ0061451.1 DHA2 family metal-tetracycline-proton antiporter-like MFS transporter [Paenibacillus harenae]